MAKITNENNPAKKIESLNFLKGEILKTSFSKTFSAKDKGNHIPDLIIKGVVKAYNVNVKVNFWVEVDVDNNKKNSKT